MSAAQTAERPRAGQNGDQAACTQAEIDAMTNADLLEAYKRTGDDRYKWPLVMRYEGMIKNVALQIRGVYSSFAQLEDIINEGILTLLSAVDKFDPDKGIKFETYISKRIRGMVIDLARKQDWMPRNVRKRSRQIDQAISELFGALGRFPTDSEVADHLGISLEKYQKDSASVALGTVLSLDALLETGENGRSRYEAPSEDAESQPETAIQEQEVLQVLTDAVSRLRKNEQLVLSLYYEKNLRMKEIAQVLDVSEARVSQIRSRALHELRKSMNDYMNGSSSQEQK